jgi:hypothetical protein
MKGQQKLLIIFGLLFVFVCFYLLGWISSQRVAYTPDDSKECAVTIDSGGNVYAVWADYSPGNWEIYFKKNFDQTGNAAKRMTWMSGPSSNPDITDSSLWNLHLAWQESISGNTEIFYKNSTDAGSNWSAVKRLTWTSGGSMNPVITSDSSGNLHLVWRENRLGKMQLHYKSSADGGSTWSKVKRLMWSQGSAYTPRISIDYVDDIHLVWEDDSSSSSDIYYKKSTDGGNTWSISKRVTWNINDSQCPDIVVDSSSDIHIVYQQFSSPNYICYKKSTDGGLTWGPIIRFNWSNPAYSPVIDVDSNDVLHVVWHESISGNDEIFYKNSTNNGVSWSSRVRLTWTVTDSQFCEAAVDNSDIVWVLWEDGPFGDKDIFWKVSK